MRLYDRPEVCRNPIGYCGVRTGHALPGGDSSLSGPACVEDEPSAGASE
jgi:hypothetical protein